MIGLKTKNGIVIFRYIGLIGIIKAIITFAVLYIRKAWVAVVHGWRQFAQLYQGPGAEWIIGILVSVLCAGGRLQPFGRRVVQVRTDGNPFEIRAFNYAFLIIVSRGKCRLDLICAAA